MSQRAGQSPSPTGRRVGSRVRAKPHAIGCACPRAAMHAPLDAERHLPRKWGHGPGGNRRISRSSRATGRHCRGALPVPKRPLSHRARASQADAPSRATASAMARWLNHPGCQPAPALRRLDAMAQPKEKPIEVGEHGCLRQQGGRLADSRSIVAACSQSGSSADACRRRWNAMAATPPARRPITARTIRRRTSVAPRRHAGARRPPRRRQAGAHKKAPSPLGTGERA